jgi:hypothetical protein
MEEGTDDDLRDYEPSPAHDGMDVNVIYWSSIDYSLLEEEDVSQLTLGPQDVVFKKSVELRDYLKLLYIHGHLDGTPMACMMVDGGATVNVMTYSTFNKLGNTDAKLIKMNMMIMGIRGDGPIGPKGVASMELTVGSKTIPTAFFVTEIHGNYNTILGCDWIHANHCVPSTLHQFLIQWVGEEVEIVHVDVSTCVTMPDSSSWTHYNIKCLSGQDILDCDFVSVSKDGFIPVSVKSLMIGSTLSCNLMDHNIEWLKKWVEKYRSKKNDICETVDDFREVEKLGHGFTSANPLEEVDIGNVAVPRPIFVNKNLDANYKAKLMENLKEYVDCFAWSYSEMPVLSRELVEHWLPIKDGFRPYKQSAWWFNLDIYNRVKEEINRLLEANFIRPCWYADWISNIIPVEKKGTSKIRVCIDFCNLNRAITKDEYPMPIADMLVNDSFGHKVISFLNGNVGYNQNFMVEEDMYKTAFRCPGFVGLFEWVVMTFGLKNAGATYQRTMNLIFHDLLGIITI